IVCPDIYLVPQSLHANPRRRELGNVLGNEKILVLLCLFSVGLGKNAVFDEPRWLENGRVKCAEHDDDGLVLDRPNWDHKESVASATQLKEFSFSLVLEASFATHARSMPARAPRTVSVPALGGRRATNCVLRWKVAVRLKSRTSEVCAG